VFRRKTTTPIEVTKLSSLVSDNMEVQGDIIFSGGLRIDGRVKGNVISNGDPRGLLILSDKGSVAGRVKVYDAVVNGHIEGDLEVEHFVELQPKARVTGNISYGQLKMECGARVDGKLEQLGGAAGAGEGEPSAAVSLPRAPQTFVT
jgi:cytoskeletal protein CcmA (bactofilin family)